MDIETLRDMCRALPAVTEDIKWGHDLCFSVAGKMFCVAALEGPLTVSFKVKDEEFDELSNSRECARTVRRTLQVGARRGPGCLNRKEWAHYVKQSMSWCAPSCRKNWPASTASHSTKKGTKNTEMNFVLLCLFVAN